MASSRNAAHGRDEATLASVACAPYKLGWAFLLAWVFCVFYLQTVGDAASPGFARRSVTLRIVFEGLPVFSSVATIAAAVALEKRFGSPLRHKAILYASPLMATLGTPLLSLQTPDSATSCAIFCFAAILTGAGSGIMRLVWGEYYASIPQDEREIAAPASAVIAALLALASSSMSGWVGMAFAASMPLVSGGCLLWAACEGKRAATPGEYAGNDAGPIACDGASSQPRDARRGTDSCANRTSGSTGVASMGRTLPGIFIACVFVCLAGGFADNAGAGAKMGTQPIILVALVFTATLAGAAIMGPRRISVSFFYRWMCPALVAGFGALAVFPGPLGTGLALATSIAARFSFCLITQMFFAGLPDGGKITATQAFGWGWIAVHLGDFVGIVILSMLEGPLENGALALDTVAVVSIVVLVTATMFVLDDTKSFRSIAGRTTEDAESTRIAEALHDGRARDASAIETPRLERKAETAAHAPGETPGGKTDDGASSGPNAAAYAESSAGTDDAADDRDAHTAQDARLRTFDEAVTDIARRSKLTPRETQVFGLLARGRSIPYIRDELVISRETAATHAKHIYAKLDVHSRQELIDLVAREA